MIYVDKDLIKVPISIHINEFILERYFTLVMHVDKDLVMEAVSMLINEFILERNHIFVIPVEKDIYFYFYSNKTLQGHFT